jgi:hypothetical protein
MAQTAAELRELPKDSLIKMAIKKINDPEFKRKEFTRTEIWTKKDEVMVKFDNVIQLVPRRGQYYSNVTVDLISGTIGRQIMGDGPDDAEVHYLKPNARHKKKVKFVLKAINNSNGEVGKITEDKLPSGTLTIIEKGMYYSVTANSQSTLSTYRIKKGSGKIYKASHKHYMRDHSPNKPVRIYHEARLE